MEQKEKKPYDELEEAAKEYAEKHGFRVPYDGSNNFYDDVDVKASKEGFIAGAEWGMNQCPLPEDTTIFLKGVAEGKRLEKDDNISLIESRIGEILGDAQPAPVLRAELRELITKIKEEQI